MSDEEIYRDDQANMAVIVYGGAAIVPTLLIGYIGHKLGGNLLMLMGAGVGAWITYAFYDLLVKVWRGSIILGIVLAMLGTIVYLLSMLWRSMRIG